MPSQTPRAPTWVLRLAPQMMACRLRVPQRLPPSPRPRLRRALTPRSQLPLRLPLPLRPRPQASRPLPPSLPLPRPRLTPRRHLPLIRILLTRPPIRRRLRQPPRIRTLPPSLWLLLLLLHRQAHPRRLPLLPLPVTQGKPYAFNQIRLSQRGLTACFNSATVSSASSPTPTATQPSKTLVVGPNSTGQANEGPDTTTYNWLSSTASATGAAADDVSASSKG